MRRPAAPDGTVVAGNGMLATALAAVEAEAELNVSSAHSMSCTPTPGRSVSEAAGNAGLGPCHAPADRAANPRSCT